MILRLVAVDNLKSKDIAKIVGYNKATIDNIISRYFKSGLNQFSEKIVKAATRETLK